MKNCSYNNANSFCTVEEMIRNCDWDTIVSYMDDDAREKVHYELAPCSAEDFLRRYLEVAPYDLIVG